MKKNLAKYKIATKIQLDEFIKDSQLIKHKDNIIMEFKLQNKEHITKSQSLKILDKYKSSVSDEIIETLSESDNEVIDLDKEKSLKTKAIDFANNLFSYAGKKFAFVKVGDEIYFKGKDIAEFLEYANTNEAIKEHVDENEKFSLEEIFRGVCQTALKSENKLGGSETLPLKSENKLGGSETLPLKSKNNLGGNNSLPLTYNEKNTIYITEVGLYELIMSSKKEEAKQFKKFITKELLPSLRKNGSYNLEPKVMTDTSFISCFYDENNICDYVDCNVVYLGVIGLLDGGLLLKYGLSSRIYDRDYIEHRATFGNQFKIVYIVKTDNNEKVEKLFEKTIKSKNLHKKLYFNGKLRDELFVTNSDFNIEKAKELLLQIANDNPTKEIKDRDDKIKVLEFNNENALSIEKEKTKQKELELKKTETDLKQKELELKKAEEITKQIETKEKEKTEQERLIIKQLELKIQLKLLEKQIEQLPIKQNENNMYAQFLNENTAGNKEGHIHCSVLYEAFENWFKINNPNTKIPSNKEFINNLKKYKDITKIKIDKIPQLGIKNLKLIKN